jgi:Zinc knuckle
MKDRAKNYWQQNNQPDDAMDVDNVAMNALTMEEKADCLKKGLCFFCKKSGHMSRNCPKKQSKGTGPTQSTIKVVTTEESAPIATAVPEGLREQMKKLPQEECQKLLDAMLEEEGF